MIILKRAEKSDAEFVLKLAQEARLESWSLRDYENEAIRADSFFIIAQTQDSRTVVGFIIARLITSGIYIPPIEEKEKSEQNEKHIYLCEIYNIAVAAESRQKGIAKEMFAKLVEDARIYRVENYQLEVRKSNVRAIGFYENIGFQIAATRRNLYRNPDEDGFFMVRSQV